MKVSVFMGLIFYSVVSLSLNLATDDIRSDRASANPPIDTRVEDRVKVPPFNVNVMLSQKAQRKLETAKETIIVSVYIYGEPQKNSSIEVNDVGMVDLANHQIELSEAGRARFDNLSVSSWKLDRLTSKIYKVNVNIFSGRHSSEDNLLSCDSFDDTIAKIQPGITLKCSLIQE